MLWSSARILRDQKIACTRPSGLLRCRHCKTRADAAVRAGVPVERLRVPGGDPAKCEALVAAHLAGHGDVGAILTLGPPGAEAVLAALSRPAAPSPGHVTFDLAATQIDGIRDRRILATVDSQQYLQGYLAVEWLWLHRMHGFTAAADIHTGPAIVDLSNVDRAAEGVRLGVR